MPRKADGLFDAWARFGALTEAARRAARGKRAKARPAAFLAHLEGSSNPDRGRRPP